MNKLFSKFNDIFSSYYENFLGIDGPLSLWINDYIIKYGPDKEPPIFAFLEMYTQLINQKQSVNIKLQKIFQKYNQQIKPHNIIYEHMSIPRDQIKYEIGRYVIGEMIAVEKPSTMKYVIGE